MGSSSTHLKNIFPIFQQRPIILLEFEGRPWNFLDDLSIFADSCDWTKELVGGTYK